MASQVQGPSLAAAMTATANYDMDAASPAFKVMLLKSTYTPDGDHQYVSSLSAYECDATGYTGAYGGAGRKTVASATLAYDAGTNRVVFDAANPATWTGLGGATNNTLRYAAVIREVTSDAASPVFAVLDFGANFVTNGSDFTVEFSASGIFYVSV